MITNRIRIAGNRQETMQRISQGFPMSFYLTDFSSGQYKTVTWHWHDDFQFCWIRSGSVLFRTAEQNYELSENMGIFLNSRLPHMAEPLTAEASYYCLNCHPQLICLQRETAVCEQMLQPFLKGEVAPVLLFTETSPQGTAFLRACERILASYQAELPGRELLMQGELLRLWPRLLKTAGNVRTPAGYSKDPRFKEIITYIRAHYAEKISLKDIADHIHLSPEECSRYFKRVTGGSLFQFILQYRLDKSAELLQNTDLTIAEISQRSGFSSQSYYTTCFHKYEGCTPNQYRISSRTV